MSPEEVQRTMQFLLHQQAQFAAELAQHAAESAVSRAQLDAAMSKLSEKTDQIADGLLGLTAIFGRVVDKVEQLADAQQRTQQQLQETQQQLQETHQQLQETDARLGTHIHSVENHLNVVVEMFERHLLEDHGRKPS
jgi:methyl-accepting chemotaxis protein